MKNSVRILTALLLCLLLATALTACGIYDAKEIVGRWRVISFTTDAGTEAAIDGHELDMIFYSTGLGEAQVDGETQYMFDYSVKNGRLTRLISHSQTNVEQVVETYEFSKNYTVMTVYSPNDGATIVLEKIEDKVLNRIDMDQ